MSVLAHNGGGKRDILDRLAALVDERYPHDRAAVLTRFLQQYYAGVPEEDMRDYPVDALLALALCHWELAAKRKADTPRVRVYNPDPARHGWSSPHTVVETVNDDMPFLVDSTLMALDRQGLRVHLTVHPILSVKRARNRTLQDVAEPGAADRDALAESFMHIEVSRCPDEALDALRADLEETLTDVRTVVDDWRAMRERAVTLCEQLPESAPGLEITDLEEIRAFVQWLADDHFTFIGYTESRVGNTGQERRLVPVAGSELGLLTRSRWADELREQVLPDGDQPARADLLVLTKATSRSTVHRPAHLDYVGVRHFDAKGRLTGESRFLGLYTSAAYHRSARTIPLLRRKVAWVLEQSGRLPNSHAGKALVNILETLPRDELIQTPATELLELASGILNLQERQRTRLFLRRDPYGRFDSCLVYVPRERYQRERRERIEEILSDELGGEDTESSVYFGESSLARVHVIVHHERPAAAMPDLDRIERRLILAVRSWHDDLRDELIRRHGEQAGLRLFQRFGQRFPAAYVADFTAAEAAADLERIIALRDGNDLDMQLYRLEGVEVGNLRFKLFRAGAPIHLSEVLPVLENMGLRVLGEYPYRMQGEDGVRVWMHDFELAHDPALDPDLREVGPVFQEAFARVWRGDAENDGFNALVLKAGLAWREVTVFRAYCRYLLQTGLAFSQAYMEEALVDNAGVAETLIRFFERRFDPSAPDGRDRECLALAQAIDDALDRVTSLDHDRILHAFLDAIRATVRTNHFQRGADGEPRSCLSIKLDPEGIPHLPAPRPKHEIFVYSPETEGVHLRGGKVARGGIRWSDRREDYRTEVLGLMKAQMVKNAVIIPVGAKGGFIVKRPPAAGDRAALREAVEACYRTFICGLLDLTDNYVGGECVPPPETVRLDDDDPYLVVAADKGTAALSDVANELARRYGFWLGDAFASGGSAGYDHKRMGITARGAWESVRRHFRELGRDIQREPFTVVGIGDMSGDVFGNGMLLSPCIRLQAAFDHRHVFVDPDPDPERSFVERRRLFELAGSSWADYDASLISEGGGVFPRQAKSVRLTPQIREALGTDAEVLTPAELIREILRAPVDLLWNGGIGTYVKASHELNLTVGDRSNDAVRVDGRELRCVVVGEGGNLGFTQLGRVEYALAGGRLNTDAIDNSGGVDCSDREVNIKILLNAALEDGELEGDQRDKLLAEMSDQVAALVLRDNYLQTQSVSRMARFAGTQIDQHVQVMRALESAGRLDRALEALPDEEALAERRARGEGLTRPEIAVLLAYVKIAVYDQLLVSDVPEDAYLSRELRAYFPETLRCRYGERMPEHRLAREIVASMVTNDLVDRMGVSFPRRLQDEFGVDAADLARAYACARETLDAAGLWRELEGLDDDLDAHLQLALMDEVAGLVEHAARWFLRRPGAIRDIAAAVEVYAGGVAELAGGVVQETRRSRAAELEAEGVPSALAGRLAGLDWLYPALDIVHVAAQTGRGVTETAEAHFHLGRWLGIDWLLEAVAELAVEGPLQARARNGLRDDLYTDYARLTAAILAMPAAADGVTGIVDEVMATQPPFQRVQAVVHELRSLGHADLGTLTIAARELRRLADLSEQYGL